MQQRIAQSIAVAIAFAIGLGFADLALSADDEPTQAWDQGKVTSLAKDLAESVDGMQEAFRRELAAEIPSADSRSRYRTKQGLRRLRTEAKQLARELEKGSGHDETIDIFLQLQQIAYRTANDAKRAMITQPTLDKIAAAREQLTELSPYYGETWKPVLETR